MSRILQDIMSHILQDLGRTILELDKEMKWLGFAFTIRLFLEKLGMSEWKAFTYENKIARFEDWLLRHPITNAVMLIDPDKTVNKGWVEMSVNGSDMKLTDVSGIWRKTYTWIAQARIDIE